MKRPREQIQALVVELTNSEVSYTNIAVAIQDKFGLSLTRNAVAGLKHRAKMAGVEVLVHECEPKPSRKKKDKKNAESKKQSKQASPEVPARVEEPSSASGEDHRAHGGTEIGKATTQSIRAGLCYYPIGDPLGDGFRYCGRQTGSARVSYCPDHEARTTEKRRAVNRGPGVMRKRLTFSLRSI